MARFEYYTNKSDVVYQNLNVSALQNLPGVMVVGENETTEQQYSYHSGVTPSKFIEHDDKRYFVKYPTLANSKKITEIYHELMISFIAKKIGIECIDSKIIIDNRTKAVGVGSLDFGPHVSLDALGCSVNYGADSTSSHYIISQASRALKRSNGPEINESELLDKLNKMCCFDFLTSQKDRHAGNIALTIPEDGTNEPVGLVPLFDNANSLGSDTRYYKLNPNDSKVFGVEQQILLNSEHRDMLTQFEDLFSDEQFPALLEEFNQIYGVKDLYGKEFSKEYEEDTKMIQQSVKERIAITKNVVQEEDFVPLPAVYASVQSHKKDSNLGKLASQLVHMPYILDKYYNKNGYEDLFKNQYPNKPKWLWYEEAKEFAKDQTSPQYLKAKRELEAKSREYHAIILERSMKGKFTFATFEDKIRYMFFDDRYYINNALKEKGSAREEADIEYICHNYDGYRELADWCNALEQSGDIPRDVRHEYKKTKGLLKRYTKYVNSCTNKGLTDAQIKKLNDTGVEYANNQGEEMSSGGNK